MDPPKPKRSPPPPARYKVLLVDDDAAVLRSTAAALEFEMDVHTSNSAEGALSMLGTGDFHVVCSDYAMGGMSGLELLKRASQLPEPVGCLLVTGSSSFMGRNHDGASDHYVLVKPVDPGRLSALILQLARTAEMKRAAKRANR